MPQVVLGQGGLSACDDRSPGSVGVNFDPVDGSPSPIGASTPHGVFWRSMQIELLNHKKWRSKIDLSIAIAPWIEHFYNPERRPHSSLGYVPPEEFEALHSATAASIQT